MSRILTASIWLFMASSTVVFSQTEYQAESSLLSNTYTSTEHPGYTGTGYVQGFEPGNIGAAAKFTIQAASSGFYDVSLRYANGYSTTSLSVYLNESKQLQMSLPTTGNWESWAEEKVILLLTQGSNTLVFRLDSGDGGRVNLDRIAVQFTAEKKPDLTISALLWAPSNPSEGSPIRFKAVIHNGGTGASPAVCHRISFKIDNQEVAVSTSYSQSLAAGDSDTLTADSTWSASHGTYTLSAIVDPKNSIDELLETNNTGTRSITLSQLPGPDLIVQSISWTPSNPAAGDKVFFSVNVHNQGKDATASAPTVALKVNGTTLTGTLNKLLEANGSATASLSGNWTAVNGSNTISATVDPQNKISEAVETNNSRQSKLFIGRGAQVPWIEYEAEDGVVAGGAKVVGPSRELGTPAGEASGRKAVMLDQDNASVEWSANAAANSIVIRVCIPDAPGGGGIEAPISLYINGQHKADIKISSAHSWVYGDDVQQYDSPGKGARKIYSEAHLLFKDFDIKAGDKVMLRKDNGDNAAYYAIDLIDLELVPASLPMPAGFISITDPNQTWAPAVPDDGIADDNAINQCIWAAQAGKYAGVYFPAGTFQQAQKIMATHVKIQGAGMWYSVLFCPDKTEDAGWGATGFNVNGDSCEFRDFAIFGWGGVRTQGGKAFVNSAHRNTVIERLWIENVQCGYWVGGPQESTNLLVKDCRFRNTGADGINLCNGNLNSVVENCHARNTGDDAFAIWSAKDLYSQPCTNNIIRNCTAQITWRAACFAIYGGKGNRIENCVGSDALTYPGLTVSSEFEPFPMESATIDGLTLYRCGGHYFTGYPYEGDFGAIWLRADQNPTNNITIKNVDVIDPTFQGILIQGKGMFTNTLLENITIANPTTICSEVKAEASGNVTFRGVTLVSNQYGAPELVNHSTSLSIASEQLPALTRQAIMKYPPARISNTGTKLTIEFVIPAEYGFTGAPVEMALYQANGKRVWSHSDRFIPGNHRLAIDQTKICQSAGFYILTLEGLKNKQTFPLVIR